METVDVWTIIITVISSIIGITLTIFLFTLKFRIGLNDNLREIKNTLKELNKGIGTVTTVSVNTLGLIDKKLNLSKEEQKDVTSNLAYMDAVQQTLNELGNFNPLTKEEVDSMYGYVRKAQTKKDFTIEEAEKFEALTKRLKKEKPNNTGVIVLAALAGILLGYYLSQQNK